MMQETFAKMVCCLLVHGLEVQLLEAHRIQIGHLTKHELQEVQIKLFRLRFTLQHLVANNFAYICLRIFFNCGQEKVNFKDDGHEEEVAEIQVCGKL